MPDWAFVRRIEASVRVMIVSFAACFFLSLSLSLSLSRLLLAFTIEMQKIQRDEGKKIVICIFCCYKHLYAARPRSAISISQKYVRAAGSFFIPTVGRVEPK